jgi:hypothetical protein
MIVTSRGGAQMNRNETVGSIASGREKVTALNPMGYPPTIQQLGMAPRF